MPINQSTSHTSDSEQVLLNKSRDDKFDVLAVVLAGYDPINDVLRRVKIDEEGSIFTSERATTRSVEYSGSNPIYVGETEPGSGKGEAKWKIMKIGYSGDNPSDIQYADGDTKYDNIWDNRGSLNYS